MFVWPETSEAEEEAEREIGARLGDAKQEAHTTFQAQLLAFYKRHLDNDQAIDAVQRTINYIAEEIVWPGSGPIIPAYDA